jgi:hypothetical protein
MEQCPGDEAARAELQLVQVPNANQVHHIGSTKHTVTVTAVHALQGLNERYGHNRKGFAQSMLGTADKGPAEDAPVASAKHVLGKIGLSSEDDDETVFNTALVSVLDGPRLVR